MAWKILLAALGAALALYLGGLWLAARSKRAVGPRPERRESYREQAAANDQAALLREQERQAVMVDAPQPHPWGRHDCPICATLPPVARPGTCDVLGQLHDGVPVEVIYAARGPR